MTPRSKLKTLQRSINRAIGGLTKIVHCPYCEMDLDFTPPSVLSEDWQPPICCAEFALAVVAILQRIELAEMKDIADRVQSKVGGPAVFN